MEIDQAGINRWFAIDRWWMDNFSWVYALAHDVGGERQRQVLPHIVGRDVLEVSFGVGYLLSHYDDKHEVTGVDYNLFAVARARRRLERENKKARLVEGDAHNLPFPDCSFDTVINIDALVIYRDPERAMQEFLRVLRPGGRLIIQGADKPTDGNLLGRLALLGVQRLAGAPKLDFMGLMRSTGLPFADHAVGSFGAAHMFLIDKPSTTT